MRDEEAGIDLAGMDLEDIALSGGAQVAGLNR